MKPLLAILALAFVLGGCGSSEEDEVRDAASSYLEALQAGNYADACQRSTAPRECLETLLAARAIGVEAEDMMPSDLAEKVRDGDVTINGDTATIKLADGSDATWHRRGDQWLAEVPKD